MTSLKKKLTVKSEEKNIVSVRYTLDTFCLSFTEIVNSDLSFYFNFSLSSSIFVLLDYIPPLPTADAQCTVHGMQTKPRSKPTPFQVVNAVTQ